MRAELESILCEFFSFFFFLHATFLDERDFSSFFFFVKTKKKKKIYLEFVLIHVFLRS